MLQRLLLTLLWLGVMVALASAPTPRDPSSGILPNAVHVIQFAVLTVVLAGLGRTVFPFLPRLAVGLLAAAVAFGLGAAQEAYQTLLPHRTADTEDLLFDAIGAGAGLLLWSLVALIRSRRLQRVLAAG